LFVQLFNFAYERNSYEAFVFYFVFWVIGWYLSVSTLFVCFALDKAEISFFSMQLVDTLYCVVLSISIILKKSLLKSPFSLCLLFLSIILPFKFNLMLALIPVAILSTRGDKTEDPKAEEIGEEEAIEILILKKNKV